MYTVIVCQLGCDVINFEINLILLDQKVKTKISSLKKTKQFLLEGESPTLKVCHILSDASTTVTQIFTMKIFIIIAALIVGFGS